MTARHASMWVTLGATLLSVGLLAMPVGHDPVMKAAGQWLTEADPPVVPEVILILTGGGAGTLLEAADLAREFPAARVVLFDLSASEIAREFLRRGAIYVSMGQYQRATLTSLGVDEKRMVTLSAGEGGTNAEIQSFRAWLEGNRVAVAAIIASWDHSARVRRVVRRDLGTLGRHVAVLIPRIDEQRPSDWWRNRTTLRAGLIELQKLLLDVVRHPLS